MITISSPAEMLQDSRSRRHEGHVIALVPTMGYLHEGHLSLIRQARERADRVVVSIFVNPTQFGPTEDYDRYPRDMQRDTEQCRQEGVDVLFCPSAADMYPAPDSYVTVTESDVTARLCGASRPGHFTGVLTVVAKLFNIVDPDLAVFGQKDAQQCCVIREMTRALNFPIEIVISPIVRESDGLAMSSRNAYLSPTLRAEALSLSRALSAAADMVTQGVQNASDLRRGIEDVIRTQPHARIDYVDIVDPVTLRPLTHVEGPALAILAVYVNKVRLIDNALLRPRA